MSFQHVQTDHYNLFRNWGHPSAEQCWSFRRNGQYYDAHFPFLNDDLPGHMVRFRVRETLSLCTSLRHGATWLLMYSVNFCITMVASHDAVTPRRRRPGIMAVSQVDVPLLWSRFSIAPQKVYSVPVARHLWLAGGTTMRATCPSIAPQLQNGASESAEGCPHLGFVPETAWELSAQRVLHFSTLSMYVPLCPPTTIKQISKEQTRQIQDFLTQLKGRNQHHRLHK